MKSRFNLFVLTIVFAAGTCITGCKSPSKKVEKVQKNSTVVGESESEFHIKKIATAEEWDNFKKEQELKMNDVEQRITEFGKTNTKPDTGQIIDTTFQEKIVKLQQKNNILRAKIKSYESNQTDWETFKQEFIRDMEELGDTYKDLTTDYKKQNDNESQHTYK